MRETSGDMQKVRTALWENIALLEKETKTEEVSGKDVNEVAGKCYQLLKDRMVFFKESFPLSFALAVGNVKVYFDRDSLIADDLIQFQKSQHDSQSSLNYTWCQLCGCPYSQ